MAVLKLLPYLLLQIPQLPDTPDLVVPPNLPTISHVHVFVFLIAEPYKK